VHAMTGDSTTLLNSAIPALLTIVTFGLLAVSYVFWVVKPRTSEGGAAENRAGEPLPG
jgi:uncharacterized protein involved in response to NO